MIKKQLFVILALMVIALTVDSCKQKKESNDPIEIIEMLSDEVSSNGDDWQEKEWNEAADKLEAALNNLPEPLETGEKVRLSSAIAKISICAGQHERKAARMLEVLEDYKNGEEDSDSSSGLSGTYDLTGTIGNLPVTMHIEIDGNQVSGEYSYDNSTSTNKLILSGTCKDGVLDINETENNVPTGHFKGKFINGIFSGLFVSGKGKKLAFNLSESGVDASGASYSYDEYDTEDYDSYESDDYDDSYSSSSSSSKGSVDVDKLLDSYESYVNQYIRIAKKVANDDMSALSEYPSLYSKAQDLGDKLERAHGQMSAAQWERYNKLTVKMLEAAQEIQKIQK